jgi:hypothetical protein
MDNPDRREQENQTKNRESSNSLHDNLAQAVIPSPLITLRTQR